MLLKIRNLQKRQKAGFSLIEAMVATAIMGISFVGVYTLTSYSQRFTSNSSSRQELQIFADQMFEIIESDKENLAFYATDLKTCTEPLPGQTERYRAYIYKWCSLLKASFGESVATDIRQIDITDITGGKLITITLQSRNKSSQIILKRFYDD